MALQFCAAGSTLMMSVGGSNEIDSRLLLVVFATHFKVVELIEFSRQQGRQICNAAHSRCQQL